MVLMKVKLMTFNKKILVLIAIVCQVFRVSAQHEDFFILQHNDTIIQTLQHQPHFKSQGFVLPYQSLLTLPFYDDFARPTIFSYSGLWADKNVFVNNSFCVLPPNINVATFDALGPDGLLYSSASTSVFAADTLTSLPINLKSHNVREKSNKLYIKLANNNYFNLNDSAYYKSTSGYVRVGAAVYWYQPSDTLYYKSGSNYHVLTDSIYTKNTVGYEYIADSKNHKKTVAQYNTSDSLFLHFAVQAGGKGDKPEANDIIKLEFYVPADTNAVLINEVDTNWIEFFNGTDSVVDLAGYYIFNDSIQRIKTRIDTSKSALTWSSFAIPNDGSIETRIPPAGFLLINAANIPAYNKFKSNILMLQTPQKHNVDSIFIPDTTLFESQSLGRTPDGNSSFGSLGVKTPGIRNGTWQEVWSESTADTNLTDAFLPVTIPITDKYNRRGFSFRFINFASLSSDPSHARSEDQWNIDDVYLNTDKNGLIPPADVVMREAGSTIYEDFTVIPHEHIYEIDEPQIRNYLTFKLKNNDTVVRQIRYFMSVRELATVGQKVEKSFAVIEPDSAEEVVDTLLFSNQIGLYEMFMENADVNKYSNFEIKLYYSDNENPIHEPYRWNDTVRINQAFYNYYAYDDGSSEAGWGVRGAENIQVAYKYKTYQADTLNAVMMYFNKTLETDPMYFNLCVWADNNGKPGTLLMKQSGEVVTYKEGVNQFVLYPIQESSIISEKNKPLIVDGTFYIGWQQPKDLLLNVGVDVNKTVKKKVYYNIGSTWIESLLSNPLMMRPVFDTNPEIVAAKETKQELNQIKVYPNPCKNAISIEIPSVVDRESMQITIYNHQGNKIVSAHTVSSLSVSKFASGMYYVTITDARGFSSGTTFIKE